MLQQILISPFWLEDTAFPLVVNCNFFLPAYPFPRGGSQSLLSPFSFSSLRVLNGPLTLPFYPFPSQPSQHKREKPSGRKGIYPPPLFPLSPPFISDRSRLLFPFFFFSSSSSSHCARGLFSSVSLTCLQTGGEAEERRRGAEPDATSKKMGKSHCF